jgi:hypothetical protein
MVLSYPAIDRGGSTWAVFAELDLDWMALMATSAASSGHRDHRD